MLLFPCTLKICEKGWYVFQCQVASWCHVTHQDSPKIPFLSHLRMVDLVLMTRRIYGKQFWMHPSEEKHKDAKIIRVSATTATEICSACSAFTSCCHKNLPANAFFFSFFPSTLNN